ncbi:TonB-dependent receptor [Terriglobus roseus]|uniref:TonB dependent receptor n=1 Tax=Terriglobus roseus TaxID=392734 RepID=A0A1H4N9D9_9BACT|nr:TonB-dependent receptor [Terriglobus roseus]SEB91388.1 TonB dependent receptor [Terriglobus roseus]
MSMYTKRSRLGLIAPAVLVSSMIAGAQTYRGGIGGNVVDSTGAAIPKARVVLKSTDNGSTRETETTSAGDYVFQDLQIGTYSVTVTASGFGDITLNKIDVNPGAVTPANAKLAVGSTDVVIDVATNTNSEIQTLSSANNAVIDSKAVSEVPLNGRSFTTLLSLAPGYNANGSLNGSRSNQLNYQIDGTDNNDIWQGGTAANQGGVGPIAGVTLPIEAIDQFSVQSSGNAEEGHSSGGLVSLALKTGTNSFHGSAYFYGRSEFFAARDFFAQDSARKQKVRNQQFGGSIGGPIFKDKLFFFTNYEHQVYNIQLSSNSLTEPGLAYVQQAQALLARHGVNTTNPLSSTLLSALWAGGNAAGLAANTNNFVESHQRHGYSDNFVGNLNYVLSPKQTIRLQAFVGTGRQAEPANSVSTYSYFQVAPDITQNFSLSHNWAPTQRLSNQLLIATGVFNQTFNDVNHSFNMPALGLNTGVTSPALFGAPTITIVPSTTSSCASGGFDCVGATQPLGRKDYTGHITDSATYIRGAHQIRFGGEFRRSYIDLQYQANTRGTFAFNGYASRNGTIAGATSAWSSSATQAQVCGTPGVAVAAQCGGVNDYAIIGNHSEVLALADYLTGTYFSGSFVQGNLRRDLYRTDLAFFIQDQYKVVPKLVLNYGVRHDYFGALSSTGPLSEWRPGATGADANGLIQVGTPGAPSTYQPGKLHFSPRVGFAWNPVEKLAVRGSYGLYFDAAPFNGFGNNGSIATGSTATGLQANPFGGVKNVSLSVGTWQKDQPVFATAAGLSNYGLFSVSPTLKTAYAHDFNLGTEYQVNKKTVFTLGYSGSIGVHLYGLRDANQAAPGVGTTATALIPRRPCYINKCVANYASVGPVQEVASNNASNFHSLQASIKSTGYKGLTAQFSWTYGHSLDNGSGFRSTGPIDSNNLALDYGNATFDIRHTLNGYLVYEAPQIGHRFAPLTKGWQGTLFANVHTSAPINITVGDNTGIGMGRDRINYTGAKLTTGSRTIQTNATGGKFIQYWNASAANTALQTPAYGSHGNIGRDAFRGPSFYDVDASLVKNTRIYENVNFQFRADIFNLFNILNPSTPTTSITSTTFGQITSAPTGITAGAPFNVQFAGKITF